MNRQLLKAKFIERTGSKALIEKVSNLLGISKRSACAKTSGARQFKPDEIDLIRLALQLTDSEVVEIFIKQ